MSLAIFVVETAILESTLKDIIRPDESSPESTATGFGKFLKGLATGTLNSSGVQNSGTLYITNSGTDVPNLEELFTDTYRLSLG